MFNEISKNYNKRKKKRAPVFTQEQVKRAMFRVDKNGDIGLDKN
jgi:hypothetical protein